MPRQRDMDDKHVRPFEAVTTVIGVHTVERNVGLYMMGSGGPETAVMDQLILIVAHQMFVEDSFGQYL